MLGCCVFERGVEEMHEYDLFLFYEDVKSFVVGRGYEGEVAWISELASSRVSETDFLREAAWVVLCGGFRESVVRQKFSYISLCFCDWESANEIVSRSDVCVEAALKAFGHRGKLRAIANIAGHVLETGFATLKAEIDCDPIVRLQMLPFIGPITAQHLAKNLGYPLAKDDRHLARLAGRFGFRSAQELCERISDLTGDSVPVVDTVLWRSAALIGAQSITRLARVA